jgi:UDP-N-acetylmuramyl tripeptide synthase
LESAQKGDVILFAWKGHETVHLTNLGKRKRSDKEEILMSV